MPGPGPGCCAQATEGVGVGLASFSFCSYSCTSIFKVGAISERSMPESTDAVWKPIVPRLPV